MLHPDNANYPHQIQLLQKFYCFSEFFRLPNLPTSKKQNKKNPKNKTHLIWKGLPGLLTLIFYYWKGSVVATEVQSQPRKKGPFACEEGNKQTTSTGRSTGNCYSAWANGMLSLGSTHHTRSTVGIPCSHFYPGVLLMGTLWSGAACQSCITVWALPAQSFLPPFPLVGVTWTSHSQSFLCPILLFLFFPRMGNILASPIKALQS